MFNFNIQSDIVVNVLSHAEATLDNPNAMLSDMGEYLTATTQERFRTSTAPDGSKWQQNSETTYINILGKSHTYDDDGRINSKGINRVMSKRPNVLSGNLMNSIHYQISGDLLLVGSNLIYAATAHFGAKKGQFGNGAPWGDIPPREYLGISVADEAELYAIAEDHILP
jgi:phage gpG-like protein